VSLSPADAAAANAAAELCRIALLDPKHQPIIDMIFLGMGEEGHVASLFPGEPEDLMVNPTVYRAVVASKPAPRRITLGYAAIASAREVWVLASGNGKKDALKESLLPGARTPLGRVWQSRTGTSIFTDIPAETG
jgi:6-phosphogluconolactonase